MTKRRIQVGRIRGRLQYGRNERVFTNDDMPDIAKEARREVIETLSDLKRPGKGRRPPWNPECRTGLVNNCHIRAPWDLTPNLKPAGSIRDLLPSSINQASVQASSSTMHAQDWQVSTCYSKSESKPWPVSTLDHVKPGPHYRSLIDQERDRIEQWRDRKLAQRRRAEDQSPIVHQSEYTMAVLEKYVEGLPVIGDDHNGDRIKFRPIDAARMKQCKYEHPGAFGPDGIWSCCANSRRDSMGCHRYYQPPRRWMYVSPI